MRRCVLLVIYFNTNLNLYNLFSFILVNRISLTSNILILFWRSGDRFYESAKYSKGRRKIYLNVFWERGVTAFLTELLFYDPGGHSVICLLSSSFMTLFLLACLQRLTIIG